MTKITITNRITYDQLDFYIGTLRDTGVHLARLSLVLFVDNVRLGWSFVDGSLVPDGDVSPGSVYFNTISGSPGYYSIRFFPDTPGFWRLIVTDSISGDETIREYEIVPQFPQSSGLNASFI